MELKMSLLQTFVILGRINVNACFIRLAVGYSQNSQIYLAKRRKGHDVSLLTLQFEGRSVILSRHASNPCKLPQFSNIFLRNRTSGELQRMQHNLNMRQLQVSRQIDKQPDNNVYHKAQQE